MPFTPFHFGPCAAIGLPARRKIDLPVFLLSNVVIDLEPGIILLFGRHRPLHAVCHSFSVSLFLALGLTLVVYPFRKRVGKLMGRVRVPYQTTFWKMFFSALAGMWFHVMMDVPLYPDQRPFYPFPGNPFFGLASPELVYILCALAFLPAGMFYAQAARAYLAKQD